MHFLTHRRDLGLAAIDIKISKKLFTALGNSRVFNVGSGKFVSNMIYVRTRVC